MNILREKQRLLPLGNPQMGGGSGGGGGSSQQTQTTELPEWARPYAKDILAKGQALTDTSQNPYQTYNAPRIAGFSPMQEQSFQGAANLAPSQAGTAGQFLAAGAGVGAMNQGVFGGREAAQYMNPYLQQSLAPQIELMQRQQAQQGAQMAGQATQAGAFGGSRFGLAQAQQNLNNQLAQQNLIGQGYNTAYQQAAQQYNADQARRLQGFQTGLQAAGTLGQLGAQEFGQQQSAIGLQNQLGAQQQALQQQGLDQAYQEFLNQQNYPYKQLGFMSDLLRGTPTGSSTAMNMYQAPGSTLGALGGIGMGLYGLNKAGLFKEGGEVEGYADGGSVDSSYNIANIVDTLSNEQLQVARENAAARGDAMTVAIIDKEYAQRNALQNSFNQGIGAAVPDQFADEAVQAAHGGIVALAEGGESEEESSSSDIIAKGLQAAASKTGMDPNQLIAYHDSLRKQLAKERAADLKGLSDAIQAQSGASKAIKEKSAGMALAAFGANMAAAASKPGATFFGSAGAGAPAMVQSLAESDKLAQAADQANLKLQLEQKRYEISARKGDEDTAMKALQNMQAYQKALEEIELRKKQVAATTGAGQHALVKLASAMPGGVTPDNLEKAANLSSMAAGIRALSAADVQEIKGLQAQQAKLAIQTGLPEGNKIGDAARAQYQVLQRQIDAIRAGRGGGSDVASGAPSAAAIPSGVTIQRIGD